MPTSSNTTGPQCFNFERILAERIAPSGGRIRIPDRPGLGLVLDDAAVERFAIR
jgi:L-alanine-DL-glutamate epimerase-like enolase superfamily enzyme